MVWKAASLATLGVGLTALAVGLFVWLVLDGSLLTGLLLGAVVSSTDAAAVFAVLRSKNANLRGQLRPLLELESGSNDPMAVFLTVGLLQVMTSPGTTAGSILWFFVVQMALGAAAGFGFGKAMVALMNRLTLTYEGIYPVFALSCAALTYGATAAIGGSGFLAVYIAGLVAANSEFVHKKSLVRFFDGMAWLSQIAMFLTLGLLVFPSQIVPVMGVGLLLSAFLMLVARPVSVVLALSFSKVSWREKIFIAWVGLRGAAPIVLATFPLLAGVQESHWIFNVVFFIVLTSALLQGWSIPAIARLLKVDAPAEHRRQYPIEFAPPEGVDAELVDLIVPFGSAAAGKSIIDLHLPPGTLVVLISRNDEYLVPSGGTVLQEGDTVLALVTHATMPGVRAILETPRPAPSS